MPAKSGGVNIPVNARKTADTACIQRITLYPIKSLDGVSVAETRIAPGGSLEHDRAFAVVDAQDKFVNGKRFAEVHRLRAHFDLDTHTVTLADSGMSAPQGFRLDRDLERMEAWMSTFFGFSVTIRQDPRAGFPDDTDASGPTVISAATLATVSAWFPGATPQDMQLRFRTNLEISGVSAFWEDRLFGEPGTLVDFNVGTVAFEGVNPCQRCVVPARHPRSGIEESGFQKTLAMRREQTLPAWAARSRFNHYYRLAVNTRIPPSEAGKTLRVGDEVTILGVRRANDE
ncbi:MAG: MOSC domain-containing protein [Chromatiales bacterium]